MCERGDVHLGVSSFTEIAVTLNFHSLQFFINSLRVYSILNRFWCTSSKFQENKYQNKPLQEGDFMETSCSWP
jgi:hypothetical protein